MQNSPKIVAFVFLLVIGSAKAQAPDARRNPWLDAYDEARTKPGEAEAVIAKATRSKEKQAEKFLVELARRFPRGRHALHAIGALGRRIDSSYGDVVGELVKKTPDPDKKLLLIRLLVPAAQIRRDAREALVAILDHHSNDAVARGTLQAIGAEATKGTARALLIDIEDRLLELYKTQNDSDIGGVALRLSRHLPDPHRIPFLMAVIENRDPVHFHDAVSDLMATGTEGTALLVADTICSSNDTDVLRVIRALPANLPADVWTRIIEDIDALSWQATCRVREVVAHRRDLDGFLMSRLADDMPEKAVVIALERLRQRGGSMAVSIAERLSRSPRDTVAIYATHVICDLTDRPARFAKTARRWISKKNLDLTLDRLDALVTLEIDGSLVGDFIRSEVKRHGHSWPITARLIAIAGASRLEDIEQLAREHADHMRWQVRLTVIEALDLTATRDGFGLLIPFLRDEHLRLANRAHLALRRLSGVDFGLKVPAWEAWLAERPTAWKPDRDGNVNVTPNDYGPRFYGLNLDSNRVVFVNDVSGSMGGPKLDTLKEQLIGAIGGIQKPGGFNIITFNSQARRLWQGLRKAGPASHGAAKRWVRKLTAGGGTDLWTGLKFALADDAADTIVVLCDGATPATVLTQTRRTNRYRRMVIHAVYVTGAAVTQPPVILPRVGSEFRSLRNLMQRLAEENGGQYILATPAIKPSAKKKKRGR